jgi:ABC-type nitrate/sulfonate/bicarbonate transport system substrate-binding protein
LRVLFRLCLVLGFESIAGIAGAQTGSTALTTLNVVYSNISVSSAPIWVTQQAGIFRKHGFDARLSFARGTLAAQAMLAGSFPVGFISPSNVVTSNLAGARMKMVGGVIDKMVYMVVSAKNVANPAQLRGKRMGISSFGLLRKPRPALPSKSSVSIRSATSSCCRSAIRRTATLRWRAEESRACSPSRRMSRAPGRMASTF